MHITTLFIWFILYSMAGWVYETLYCSIKGLKWDNRGMLIGPYCPIYGVGAILDILLCSNFTNAMSVFFACVVGSAILEYVTSYTTERLFHAVWWDYSYLPLNLHGRICLQCSLSFGAAGIIVLYGIHPYMKQLTAPIPVPVQELLSLLFMAVFAADCALTADAIDSQIAEKYNKFIENAKQNLSDGLDNLKEKISFEEYRERRMHEEVNKTTASLSWVQIRSLRSCVSFRHSSYSEIGNRMKHVLSFRKKNRDVSENGENKTKKTG